MELTKDDMPYHPRFRLESNDLIQFEFSPGHWSDVVDLLPHFKESACCIAYAHFNEKAKASMEYSVIGLNSNRANKWLSLLAPKPVFGEVK